MEPSSEASDAPSSAPSDSCLASEGGVEFVVRTVLTTWLDHKFLARSRGCELASIKTRAEQIEANNVLRRLRQILPAKSILPVGRLVWIGAENLNPGCSVATCGGADFQWIDGSGSVPLIPTPGPKNGNPIPGGRLSPDKAGNTSRSILNEEIDLNGTTDNFGYGLYKCCSAAPLDFGGYDVPRSPQVQNELVLDAGDSDPLGGATDPLV